MRIRHYVVTILSILLVVAGSAALGVSLWDRDYPTWLDAWRRGDYVYRYFRHRLVFYVVFSLVMGSLLWAMGAAAHARRGIDRRTACWRQALPFMLLLPTPLLAVRYSWHPLGTTYGSSLWTYLLITPLAAFLAAQLAPLIPAPGLLYRRHPRSLWALIMLFLTLFGGLAFARHLSFQSHALDLGTMAQAAWNTAHGRAFEYTPLFESYVAAPPLSSRLASGKLELVFLGIAPLYAILPSPLLLLALQTSALGFSAWPLYHALRHLLRAHAPAIILTAAYLSYLPLHYVAMADFHPSALTPFFLTWAMYFALKERWRAYTLALVGALICRVDAAFVAGGLSVFLLWRRAWRPALWTLALAVGWLALDFRVAVPWAEARYGPDPVHLMSQRGQYGSSPMGVIAGVLRRPTVLLALLHEREKLQTAFDLLVPLGWTPLLAPAWLLPAAPVAFLNLLADSAWQGTVKAHYFAPVLPFLFLATGAGIRWLHGWFTRWRPVDRSLWVNGLALYVLISTLAVGVYLSPFPPGRDFRLSAFWTWSPHHDAIRSVMKQVDPHARLSGQSNLLPHLAQRRFLYLFPSGDTVADEVILDLDFSAERAPLDFYAFYQAVDALIANPEFGLKTWQNGVLLLARGYPHQPSRIRELRAAYDAGFYRVRWLGYKGPTRMDSGEVYRVRVCVQNTGTQGWRSTDWHPTKLSYHWRNEDGTAVVWDGERTSFHTVLYPEQQRCLRPYVYTPERPGTYTLQFDLVREEITWFSDAQAPTLDVAVEVR